MAMLIFLDESGDLGWKLDKPYRNGGSSRYLTIAAMLIPDLFKHFPQRIVKKIYKHKHWSFDRELKSTCLSPLDKFKFINLTCKLLHKEPEIKLFCITVYKSNVQKHIRRDANKLYNYMINLLLLDHLKQFPEVTFIPDPRTIKVKSANSLADYLQIELWFKKQVQTTLINHPIESKDNLNLQFVDFVAKIVWEHYEDGESAGYQKLQPFLCQKELFFP